MELRIRFRSFVHRAESVVPGEERPGQQILYVPCRKTHCAVLVVDPTTPLTCLECIARGPA